MQQRRERASEYGRTVGAARRWVRPSSRLVTGVYHLYVIRTADREGLMEHLKEAGIGTGIHYPIPLHLQERVCGAWATSKGEFPAAERAAAEIVSLPMFPQLTAKQAERVADEIRAFLFIRKFAQGLERLRKAGFDLNTLRFIMHNRRTLSRWTVQHPSGEILVDLFPVPQSQIAYSYVANLLARRHKARILTFRSKRYESIVDWFLHLPSRVVSRSYNSTGHRSMRFPASRPATVATLIPKLRLLITTKSDLLDYCYNSISLGIDVYESYLRRYSQPTPVDLRTRFRAEGLRHVLQSGTHGRHRRRHDRPAVSALPRVRAVPIWVTDPAQDYEHATRVQLIDMRFGTPSAPGFEAIATVNDRNQVVDSVLTFGQPRAR